MGEYVKKTIEYSCGMKEITKCMMPTLGRTEKRAAKSVPSSEKQQKKNLRRCAEELHAKLQENFFPGDYNIVLTYPRAAAVTLEQAERVLADFLYRYKRYCRKNGYKPEYIDNTEQHGPKGNIHHHIILHNHADIELIEELWSEAGGGSVQYRGKSKLRADRDWKDLAWYFVDRTKKGKYPDTHIKGKRRYSASHGLKKPKVTYERIEASRWYAPRAPKGWYIVPDSIYEGDDELTGARFQKYLLRRMI